MITAAIYDMDDLMVNSNRIHTAALDAMLKKHGHSLEELSPTIQATFVGRRLIDILGIVVDQLHLPLAPAALNAEREQIFLQLVKTDLEPMPGLLSSLQLFKNNNLKIALATSATTAYANLVLDKFLIRHYFDAVVTGQDVTKGKPDPETYTVAAQKLRERPENCLVLEDATNGIAAAKGAGCKCIGVENHYTPPQDRSAADVVIPSLEALTWELVREL